MKTYVIMIGIAALLAACGGDKDKGDNKGGAKGKAKAANTAGAGPKIDCAAFDKKVKECLDPLAKAYAATEFGKRAGVDTKGGTPDLAKAEKRFRMLVDMQGAKMCTGYANKDGRWRKRLSDCMSKTACGEWAPCAATAMGEPLR